MSALISTELSGAGLRRMVQACTLAGLLALAGCGGDQAPSSSQAAAVQGGVAPTAVRQAAAGDASAYNSTVQDIYIAYFGRPADPGGLVWYAGLLAASGVGASRAEVIAAYNTNAAVKDIIDSFGNSTESQALYGGTSAQFVTAIYGNLFNRLPDAAGLNYWAQAIDSGQVTRAAAAIAIMGGAQSTDAGTITAKNQVSASFTGQITDPKQYNGLDAGAVARTMLATIHNGDDATTAQQRVNDAVTAAKVASGWHPPVSVALTGIFLDAPVSGLTYRASPSGATGATNALGQFRYAAGDSVTFTAAGLTLGTTSKLATDATQGNPAVVTPLDLVPGAADATDASVTAIAQWLADLNTVTAAVNQSTSGTFKLPVTTGLSGTQASTVTALLGAAAAAQTTVATLPAALASGGALQAAIAAAGGKTLTAAAVQANVRQAQNSAGYIGSFWTADCATCDAGQRGGLIFYLEPNGVVRGFGKIASIADDRDGLMGTWQASTAVNGGVSFNVVSAAIAGDSSFSFDGSYVQGTLNASSGTASVYNGSGQVRGAMTLSRMTAATGANAAYVGSWVLILDTITDVGHSKGMVGGGGHLLAAPDGQIYLFSPDTNRPKAPWNMASGLAAPFSQMNTDLSSGTACGGHGTYGADINVNLASGTLTVNGWGATYAPLANGSLLRSGLAGSDIYSDFADNAGTVADAAAEKLVPFALNADIHWPDKVAGENVTSSLVLGVLMTGMGKDYGCGTPGSNAGGTNPNLFKINAFGVHPVINPLGNGAGAATVRDTIAFQYVQGQPANYQIVVLGPAARYCSVTQNSGAVIDANIGKPDAYPTVLVTCTQ